LSAAARTAPEQIAHLICELYVRLGITGLIAPAAQAVDKPGDWIYEKQYQGDPLDPPGAIGDVAVDRNTGDIVFTDAVKHQLLKVDKNGNPLFRIGAKGNGNGFFDTPTGVTIDKFGAIYVADTGNNRIQKFEPNGDYMLQFGALGSGDGELKAPQGISVDGFGRVLVADTGNHRIEKFTNTGTYNGQWGSLGAGEKQFNKPTDVAVDAVGNFVVADSLNHRIQQFKDNGNFLRQWGKQGNTPGNFDTPTAVIVDISNNIYVADAGNKRVQKFSSIGQFDSLWNAKSTPSGIATDNSTASFYVAEGQGVGVYRQAVAPGFVTGPQAARTAGMKYDSTVVTSGVPVVPNLNIVDGALPPGYVLDGHRITGVSKKPGIYKVTFKADNNVEFPVTQEYEIKIRKAKSKISTKTISKTVKSGYVSYKTKVRISAPGTVGLSRTGRINVYYGGKVVKQIKIYKSNHGAKTVSLPRFKASKRQTIILRFIGQSQLRKSTKIYGKAVSKVSRSLSDTTPTAGKTLIKAKVKVSTPHVSSLSKAGKISVYYGSKRVKTVSLTDANNGTKYITLPRISKKGYTKITFKYSGNSKVLNSKRSITVRAH